MNTDINFSLIGRSGSGKGTQAEKLRHTYSNIRYIYTGDLFRDVAKQDTQVGHKIQETLKYGNLPFEDLATALWMHEIAYFLREDQSLMLDGAPRRLPEAENLDIFLKWLGRLDRTAFIYLDISREEAFDRLTKRRICTQCKQTVPYVGEYKTWNVCGRCGGELIHRVDDIPEAINNRLNYFEEQVMPVVHHYEKQDRLIRIDASQDIETVAENIARELRTRFSLQ